MQLDIKRKKNTWLKSEQKNWRDIFPKRKCRWPTSTWKDAQHHFSSVQSLSCVWLFVTLWTTAQQASLSITNSRSLTKTTSIESVMPSNHHPLSSPSPPAPNPFQHHDLSNESALCIRWPKYWSFSFIISPSSEYSGLISFRIDWLDLLAVQGTLKSLFQHYSSKASVLQNSALKN